MYTTAVNQMTPEQRQAYLAAIAREATDEMVLTYITKYGDTINHNGRMCCRLAGGIAAFYESISMSDDNESNFLGHDSLGSY